MSLLSKAGAVAAAHQYSRALSLIFRSTICALALVATSASATTLWTIDATLTDFFDPTERGTVVGSFDFDGMFFSNVNIAVIEESGFTTSFDDADLDTGVGLPQFSLIQGLEFGSNFGDLEAAPLLVFEFFGPLTPGSVVSLTTDGSFFGQCSNEDCSEAGAVYQIAGSVSAVPLPAAVWLFLSAVGGLVGVRLFRPALTIDG